MRAVECPCGEHLEGSTDTDLIEAAKRHAAEDHEEGEFSEADLRLLVNTSAYDTTS